MLSSSSNDSERLAGLLAGEKVAIVGRLAGMNRRDAQELIKQSGAAWQDAPDLSTTLIVLGEHEFPLGELAGSGMLSDEVRAALETGKVQVLGETQLWQRLGFVEDDESSRKLYTPAMLADLVGVPIAIVRRWHRRGLIVPAREVRRLPYFDFQEVSTARRLAELLAAGCSPQSIERQLAAIARQAPSAQRPLAQLSIIVEGKRLLLRQGDGLVEPGGQFRFDFEGNEQPTAIAVRLHSLPGIRAAEDSVIAPPSREELLDAATGLDDEGRLDEAIEAYRTVLAAGGPDAEVNFAIAELLYRQGDLSAARERYWMAIELDEEYVEARANLGCILAELGDRELAVAALKGTLDLHPDYADVHYHLGCTLDELGRRDEARQHWTRFEELAPESPWSAEARTRLEEPD